jgi:hypothetical protein
MSQFKYQMLIQWSEEDNCFLVGFSDFPGQRWRTHGDTSTSSNYLTLTKTRDVGVAISPIQRPKKLERFSQVFSTMKLMIGLW